MSAIDEFKSLKLRASKGDASSQVSCPAPSAHCRDRPRVATGPLTHASTSLIHASTRTAPPYRPAQVELGERLLAGGDQSAGAAPNAVDAVWWFTMAAYQGLPAGQHALGRCLEHGYGVEANLEEAVTWYRLAVDASYAPAIESLGASFRAAVLTLFYCLPAAV